MTHPENDQRIAKIEWNKGLIRKLRDIPHTGRNISNLQNEILVLQNEIIVAEAFMKNPNLSNEDYYKILDNYDRKGNSYCGTFREVGGIVYQLAQSYGKDRRAKEMAMAEAYFQRQCNNKYARAMRVIHGPSMGRWACYVSMCNRGEE
jgi:hypothetical protein